MNQRKKLETIMKLLDTITELNLKSSNDRFYVEHKNGFYEIKHIELKIKPVPGWPVERNRAHSKTIMTETLEDISIYIESQLLEDTIVSILMNKQERNK